VNPLKDFPFRLSGGSDWSMVLATMRGWVTTVANTLEQAPSAGGYISVIKSTVAQKNLQNASSAPMFLTLFNLPCNHW
jgi:hypothetical protein